MFTNKYITSRLETKYACKTDPKIRQIVNTTKRKKKKHKNFIEIIEKKNKKIRRKKISSEGNLHI